MNHWVVIYAIGAAQAVLLALALSRRRVNPQANRVLAAWVAIVGVDLAIKALFLAEPTVALYKPYRFVALFPFLYASLFYVYVRVLTTGRGFGARDLVHFAGFAFVLAWVGGLFLLGPADTAAEYAQFVRGEGPGLPGWFDPLLFGYAFSYIIAALVRMHRYRRQLRERRSDADRQSLRWITAMALCQLVIWCIAAAQWLLRIPQVDYYLIYGAVAAWVCVVAYFSLAQPPVAELVTESSAPQADEGPARDDDPRFDEVQSRLSQLMRKERLYREPALTIGQLARRSGYPEYLVSAVINRRLGANFWDYINRQRIEAASACLADPGDRRTILDIAYACGFTSKSTFNAAFKRQLGETPSGYRRQHAGRSPATAGSVRTRPG
ncbi:helix-turn-helix domain-containing protein [Lysobacter sp. D1-1-M9]|uniref:helix-turn-helix domain-containing protein n=1 Tax=Novilysobacter longmucuonensis TaxID=3098603 RepID=UPI002FC79FE9